jgi:quercetin dioxygenase-like cupin family protein
MAVELDVGQPLLLPPGGGEIIGDSAARRIEILSDHDELHATWSRPNRDGASPHVHRSHSDLFYVLEGELTFLVGPERVETVLPAGTLVLAPPLVVHAPGRGPEPA